jgi:hypothetical protein
VGEVVVTVLACAEQHTEVLEVLAVLDEQQGVLGRVVAEERAARDVGCSGDLGHRGGLVTLVLEQRERGLGERFAGLVLLALTQRDEGEPRSDLTDLRARADIR